MPRNTLGPVRCHARNKQGEPCGAWAIHGGVVCGQHGGRAPQVKAKAEERIRAMIFPALARLEQLIGDVDRNKSGAESEAVALAAARDILDRAGYSATHRLEMSGELSIISPIDLELEELGRQLRENAEVKDASS